MSGVPPPVPLLSRRVNTLGLSARRWSPATPRPAAATPPRVQKVARPVVAVQRTELDGSGRRGGNAVFVTPDTLVADYHLAVSSKGPKLVPWLRLQIGEAEMAATVVGYSHAWRLVALSARGLRGEPASWRPSRTLRPGEPVSVLVAVGEDLRAVDGEIVGLSLTKERSPYERHYEIETSVPAWPNSELAGLFDSRGNLIGIGAARTADGRLVGAPADHLNLASRKYVARGLLGNGAFLEAMRELRPMVQKGAGAEDPELWCMLAVCGEGLGRGDERRAALRRACVLDDQNAWAAHALGLALLSPPAERGQALAALRRAVALEPWNDRYRRALDDAQG